MKTAIITGVCGQSGAYLAKLLLEKNYRVIGWARRNSSKAGLEYLGIADSVEVVDVDICDPYHVRNEISRAQPDEIYNLAAQSHVGQSFKNPMQTCAVNYGGYLNVLLSARQLVPLCKIYQAGTSEMFGYSADTICNEQTPFAPMSPYAISKVAAHWAGVNARYEANQFVANGILFNHESPLRGKDFVTRKVTDFVKNPKGILYLGNLDAQRDWGFAGDYVEAMWLMLQQDVPNDFVIATGISTTIRNMVKTAFAAVGKDLEFKGEIGYVDGVETVKVDPEFLRPNDLQYLKGNASKARQLLGWTPKVTVDRLITEMVKS